MAKRRRKGNAFARILAAQSATTPNGPQEDSSHGSHSKLEQLVDEVVPMHEEDPLHRMYTDVLEHFRPQDKPALPAAEPQGEALALMESRELVAPIPTQEPKVSLKRKRISLVELKELAPRPELVEWFDADALEPELLVKIKSTPGVVPVPLNWPNRNESVCFRKDLSYRLPPNIAETGIGSMRDVAGENQEPVNLRQRTRERIQPRLGRLDQDFRKLHAAIFKSTYKPRLRPFGRVWSDRASYRAVGDFRFEAMRPGHLSSRLQSALGLKATEQPQFVAKIKELGVAPGYAAFGITEFASTPTLHPVKLWGEMELDESSEEEITQGNDGAEDEDINDDDVPQYDEDST